MKKLSRFKSKEEEADFWMANDTTAFWDSLETVDAIKQGIDEFAQGKGVPARQALEKLRHIQ